MSFKINVPKLTCIFLFALMTSIIVNPGTIASGFRGFTSMPSETPFFYQITEEPEDVNANQTFRIQVWMRTYNDAGDGFTNLTWVDNCTVKWRTNNYTYSGGSWDWTGWSEFVNMSDHYIAEFWQDFSHPVEGALIKIELIANNTLTPFVNTSTNSTTLVYRIGDTLPFYSNVYYTQQMKVDWQYNATVNLTDVARSSFFDTGYIKFDPDCTTEFGGGDEITYQPDSLPNITTFTVNWSTSGNHAFAVRYYDGVDTVTDIFNVTASKRDLIFNPRIKTSDETGYAFYKHSSANFSFDFYEMNQNSVVQLLDSSSIDGVIEYGVWFMANNSPDYTYKWRNQGNETLDPDQNLFVSWNETDEWYNLITPEWTVNTSYSGSSIYNNFSYNFSLTDLNLESGITGNWPVLQDHQPISIVVGLSSFETNADNNITVTLNGIRGTWTPSFLWYNITSATGDGIPQIGNTEYFPYYPETQLNATKNFSVDGLGTLTIAFYANDSMGMTTQDDYGGHWVTYTNATRLLSSTVILTWGTRNTTFSISYDTKTYAHENHSITVSLIDNADEPLIMQISGERYYLMRFNSSERSGDRSVIFCDQADYSNNWYHENSTFPGTSLGANSYSFDEFWIDLIDENETNSYRRITKNNTAQAIILNNSATLLVFWKEYSGFPDWGNEVVIKYINSSYRGYYHPNGSLIVEIPGAYSDSNLYSGNNTYGDKFVITGNMFFHEIDFVSNFETSRINMTEDPVYLQYRIRPIFTDENGTVEIHVVENEGETSSNDVVHVLKIFNYTQNNTWIEGVINITDIYKENTTSWINAFKKLYILLDGGKTPGYTYSDVDYLILCYESRMTIEMRNDTQISYYRYNDTGLWSVSLFFEGNYTYDFCYSDLSILVSPATPPILSILLDPIYVEDDITFIIEVRRGSAIEGTPTLSVSREDSVTVSKILSSTALDEFGVYKWIYQIISNGLESSGVIDFIATVTDIFGEGETIRIEVNISEELKITTQVYRSSFYSVRNKDFIVSQFDDFYLEIDSDADEISYTLYDSSNRIVENGKMKKGDDPDFSITIDSEKFEEYGLGEYSFELQVKRGDDVEDKSVRFEVDQGAADIAILRWFSENSSVFYSLIPVIISVIAILSSLYVSLKRRSKTQSPWEITHNFVEKKTGIDFEFFPKTSASLTRAGAVQYFVYYLIFLFVIMAWLYVLLPGIILGEF